MPSFLRDERGLTFAPPRHHSQRLRVQPDCQLLEERALLASLDPFAPTADEQYMLELVNRARANPAAEGQRLLQVAQTDPVVASALQGWNLNLFAQVISSFGPLPPLAFNTRLIQAARAEDATMLAQNNQVHSPPGYLTDPTVARATDGQAYYPVGNSSWAVGENIFAYSQNVNRAAVQAYVDYFYAGFMLDWGNLDFDHMKNVLAPGPGEASLAAHYPFSEVGIGLLTNVMPTVPPPPNPSNPANLGLNVGPDLVTQEFGWRSGSAFLTGVAYQDNDNNQFYTPGEGLGSVVITATGTAGQGTFQTTTWGSGGYSLQLPPGVYNVTATGNLPSPRSTVVSIGVDNVGWDLRFGPASRADLPVPGDYDGDRRTDLAVFRPASAQWFMQDSSAGPQVVQFGAPGLDIPVPGNYDGTGRTEVAVYRPSTAQWFILGPTGGRVVAFGGPGLDLPVPGDYDGDGRTDLAVFRPSTGQWFILGSRTGPRALQFGGSGLDTPVPGNYDGTGRVEPAVYRPSTAQWFILGPTGGRVVAFGAPGLDIPLPGDYDGDGRTDLAVYRPSTAGWYVIRSHDGPLAAMFGAPGLDSPVPGDYDGIGRSEVAVYRPTTAQWFIVGVGGGRALQLGQGGLSSPLSPYVGAVVSLGGQTSRYGASSGNEAGSLTPDPSSPTAVAAGPFGAGRHRSRPRAHTAPRGPLAVMVAQDLHTSSSLPGAGHGLRLRHREPRPGAAPVTRH